MQRGFRRFDNGNGVDGNKERPANADNTCECLGSLKLTNILLIIITAMTIATVVLKAVEDGEAGPMVAEGMQHVRYFRNVAEWGQAVFHNATMEVVANNATAPPLQRRQRSIDKQAETPAVNGSDPEVAVVRELLELLIHTNTLMDRAEREGAVERAAAVMALMHEVGTSKGVQLAGTMLRKGLEDMHSGSAMHSQNETENFMAHMTHIASNVDNLSHEMAQARLSQQASAILDKTGAMLGRVEETQMLEYVHHVLTISASLLQELKTANATDRVVDLLEKADAVLDETRQTLDGVLGDGLTLSLGGGKR